MEGNTIHTVGWNWSVRFASMKNISSGFARSKGASPQYEGFPRNTGKGTKHVPLYFSGTVMYPTLPLLTSLTRSIAPPSFAAWEMTD